MKITGTFLDEISHDIPSQNWGRKDWEEDFKVMQSIGINTVILIRCGHKKWMTYPSKVLEVEQSAYPPPMDLVDMYLKLSEKYGMAFYFGTYDSGDYWSRGEFKREIELSVKVVDEAWKRYGSYPAFKGWYLSLEVSRNTHSIIDIYSQLGRHCKKISGGLKVLISPYIAGVKAVDAFSAQVKGDGISLEQHEQEWNAILKGLAGAVDIVAFQDGHVEYHELGAYLRVNKKLADAHGLESWTNLESFDRDMPIKFLPIKWEKMLLKLNAAKEAGLAKAITFEFSHFMSPNSSYLQAHGLFERYCEQLGIKEKGF
jgi:hypothetical protein